jgi:hypothetical protein
MGSSVAEAKEGVTGVSEKRPALIEAKLSSVKQWIKSKLRKPYKAPPKNGDSLLLTLAGNWPDWCRTIDRANDSRVLIATSMANYNHAAVVERSIAVALTLRGARVEFLLCDSALPACQMTKLHGCAPDMLLARSDTPRCAGCLTDAQTLFDPMGLPVRRFSEYLSSVVIEKARATAATLPIEGIPFYSLNGVAVGEHAMAGALRYFGRGDLAGEPHGEAILRRFLQSALITAAVMTELLHRESYDVVVFHHGIYTPQGIIGEVCRRQEVRVVNWNPSYRKSTFIFSHGDTYHHTMITEQTAAWSDIPWTEKTERLTMDYLNSRRDGSSDWIWFHEHPENDADALAKEFGIDWSKPCIGLLTSVIWDAQLHYQTNAFPNMLEWIVHTIDYFRGRPDLQLLIRVHPAEVRGMVPSRQRITDEIVRLIREIPANVFVIPPEHQASTYALMDRCDSVLIFNTKTGIELSAIGIPVVVAGEAWIRNKGFSMDARSPADYDRILDTLPVKAKLPAEHLAAAKRYAFHFFFRRMIELPFIKSPEKYSFSVSLGELSELELGRLQGLDVVCNGILHNAPFVVNYEL